MHELILLRHAHANSAAAGQEDVARELSPTGLEEAVAAAAWLQEHGLRPDRILVSPAQRTRETARAVQQRFPDVPCDEVEAIYEATPGELIALAGQYAKAGRVLVVGHNPGLEQLVALLHSGQSGDYRGMPPAAIAVLRIPGDAAIEPGVAELTAFWWP